MPSPLLAQIPLVVSPGSYKKVEPITLPYDFEELPENLQGYQETSVKPLKEKYGEIVKKNEHLQGWIGELYSDTSKEKFQAWEKDVRMIAPGYIAKDGSVGVMSPTRRN